MFMLPRFFILLCFIWLTACGGGGSSEETVINADVLPTDLPITDQSPHSCLQGTWKAVSQTGVNGNTINVGTVYMVVAGLTPDQNNGNGGSVYSYSSNTSGSSSTNGMRIFQLEGGQVQDTYTKDWTVLITSHVPSGTSDGLFTITDACSTVYNGANVTQEFPSCGGSEFTNTSDVTINCSTNPAQLSLNSGIAAVNYERINTSADLAQPSTDIETQIPDDTDNPTDPEVIGDGLNAVPSASDFSGEDSPSFLSEGPYSDEPWRVNTSKSATGGESYQSADLFSSSGEFQSSYAGVSRYFVAGDVSFWYRVASDGDGYFRFYIDGIEQLEVYEDQNWQFYSSSIEEGHHRLSWHYTNTNGAGPQINSAWIDNVVVPDIDSSLVNDPGYPAVNNAIYSQVITTGDNFHHGVKDDGTLWSWGVNYYGSIGNGGSGNDSDVTIPTQVNLQNVVAVDSFYFHSLALLENGTVWSWGLNGDGQLGNGESGNDPWGDRDKDKEDRGLHHESYPVQVIGLDNVVQVSAGNDHSLALKQDGTVWSWGDNYSRELGHPAMPARNIAEPIHDLTNITQISAGLFTSVALRSDGRVLVWGDLGGSFGGDSSYIDDLSLDNSAEPIVVPNLEDVVAIDQGGVHILALKSDGTVWGWGANVYGRLGDGSTSDSSSPVQAVGLDNVTAIATNGLTSAALKSDGTVWTWGGDQYGNLCHESRQDRHSPTQTGLTNIVAISVNAQSIIAVDESGDVFACGYNYEGTLGVELPQFSSSSTVYPAQRITSETGSGFFNLGSVTTTPPPTNTPPDDPDENGSDHNGEFSTPDGADFGWETDALTQLEGNSSFTSIDIEDDDLAAMEYRGTFVAGTLSFSYKVSSEGGWDYFKFYIDGVKVLERSGEIDWTEFSYTLTAGEHTLLWVYVKDSSFSAGDDKVWIANIQMPDGSLVTPDSGSGGGNGELVVVNDTLNYIVEGLTYSTEVSGVLMAQGTTDALGSYQYVQGHDVNFYLGDMLMHTQPGEASQEFFDTSLLPTISSEVSAQFKLDRIPVDDTSLLLNRARLLLTLDTDQDPTNGIQIDTATVNTFETFSLSIQSRPQIFATDAGSIIQLFNRKLLAINLTVFHLYTYLEIDILDNLTTNTPNHIILSTTEDGNNLTDSVDGVVDYTGTYQYDEFDHMIRESYSNNSGGGALTYSYDEFGYLIEKRREVLVTNDAVLTWEYNASGFNTLYQVHDENNVLEDEDINHYDSQGNLSSVEGQGHFGSGLQDTITNSTYDNNGNMLTSNYSRSDYSSNDVRQYDLLGRRTYRRRTASSGIDDTWTYTYDAAGNLLEDDYDRGNIVRNELKTFNENNQVLTFQNTTQLGARDIVTFTTYQYDINGLLTQTEIDKADTNAGTVIDGIIEETNEFTYDANDNLLYSNIVGQLPSSISEYNSENLLTKTITDNDKDGVANSVVTHEYDANNIISKTTNDNAADDVPEKVTTWVNRPTRMIAN